MKKFRSFVAGMLTMLVIVSLAGTALATTGKVQKELEYRNISVTLDGEKLDLRDAKGNAVEPFMFDGTNYLPVRALAESLGLTVSWDGSTNTVVLTSDKSDKNEEASPKIEKLLVSKDHVRLYFLGIESSNGNYEAHFRVENDSDYKINVFPRDLTVSGKSVDFSFSCQAEPGRTGEGTLVITKDALNKSGIETVKRIVSRFYVLGGSTLDGGVNFETGNYTLSND